MLDSSDTFWEADNITAAEIFFSPGSWESITIASNEKLLKPRYMSGYVDWQNFQSVQKANVPFIRVVYSIDRSIIEIEAYPGLVREVPVFYTVHDQKLLLSDDPKNLLHNNSLDELSVIEFLSYGYVTSHRTLLEKIYSIQAGTILCFKGQQLQIKTVYLYGSTPESDKDSQELFDGLNQVSEEVFHDLIHSLKDKHVLLPLSAGYDSRYIAAMLKRGGFENVTCFAWGLPENKDVRISNEIADKLGYKWELIDLSEQNWRESLDSEWLMPLLVFASKYVSISGVASIPFQKLIRERNYDDCIVIPGHTGDFISGGQLPVQISKNSSETEMISLIMDKHIFASSKSGSERLFRELEKQINIYTSLMESYRKFESWNLRERQSKFITNTNRYYEAIGMEWSMPLWDNRFVRFWDSVPLDLKKGSILYDSFLEKKIFSETFVDFGLRERGLKKQIINQVMLLIKKSALKKITKKLRFKRIIADEFGLYKSLPYFYRKIKETHPTGFKQMTSYCEKFGYHAPENQKAYHSRSILAMILEDLKYNASSKS